MVKSPARNSVGMRLGLGSLGGLGVHVSVMWVLVLFVLITAFVCTYAGLYEKLPRRQFPATTINGELIVEGQQLARALYSTMTVSTVATSATLTYAADTITVNDFTGAAAQAVTLPAAKRGRKVIHYQDADTTGGTNTLTFNCAGSDVWRTGSVILAGTAAAGATLDTSTAGETLLTFTPANATTNFISAGSQFVFWCVEDGIWEVALDNSQCRNNTLTAVTGAIAFGA